MSINYCLCILKFCLTAKGSLGGPFAFKRFLISSSFFSVSVLRRENSSCKVSNSWSDKLCKLIRWFQACSLFYLRQSGHRTGFFLLRNEFAFLRHIRCDFLFLFSFLINQGRWLAFFEWARRIALGTAFCIPLLPWESKSLYLRKKLAHWNSANVWSEFSNPPSFRTIQAKLQQGSSAIPHTSSGR